MTMKRIGIFLIMFAFFGVLSFSSCKQDAAEDAEKTEEATPAEEEMEPAEEEMEPAEEEDEDNEDN